MIESKKHFKFTECSKINTSAASSKNGIFKTASGNILIEPGSEKHNIVQAEIKKHPNALFFRAKAIEADIPNNNGDCFSAEEILKAYKSFEGVPFFTNHDNQNIENARGKVVFAEWVEDEKAVYTISFIDRDAYPHICRSIEEEYVRGVSMGASVEYSVCNICGNKAETTDNYCTHIKNRKGRKFTGTARDVRTGEVKHFKDEPVYEHNHGIKFIELSAVVDPACPSCNIEGIIPNQEYLSKVANVENQVRMIKTAALRKDASQQELDEIEECLSTLEGIAVNLIKNRKQVEPEFASDLVDIVSNLQEWADELTAAGYANFEAQGDDADMDLGGGLEDGMGEGLEDDLGAVDDAMMGDQAGQEQAPQAPPQMPAAQPVGMQEEVGDISGDPTQDQVKTPSLPITSPVRPRASSDKRAVLARAKDLMNQLEKINSNNGENVSKRRTKAQKDDQKNSTVKILSNSWKEKQDFFEYMKKVPTVQNQKGMVSVASRDNSMIIVAESKENIDDVKVWTYEDLNDSQKNKIKNNPQEAANNFLTEFISTEGANNMSEIKSTAGAKSVHKTPDVVQEKQLEAKDLYHARQNDDKHQTTQAQLEARRKGEKDYTTEKQLDDAELKMHPRNNADRDEITEAQFGGEKDSVSPRSGEETHSITQVQMEGNRKNNEPEVITERQLDDIDKAWERFASRDASLFKSTSEHMSDVIVASANTVIATGCTPSELVAIASDLVGTLKDKKYFALSIAKEGNEEDVDFSKRLAFWNNKNIKVAGSSKKDIAEVFVNNIRKVANDEQINPEVLMSAVDIVAEGEIAEEIISEKIEDILSEQKEVVAKKSTKSELREALASISKKKLDESKDSEDKKQERIARRKKLLSKVSSDSKVTKKASLDKSGIPDEVLNKEAALKSDYVIATDFDELGVGKKDPTFKTALKTFAKKAMASENVRVASITNVTIDGNSIQIAVQTDSGEESIDIPLGDATMGTGPSMEEQVPEADMTGEGIGQVTGPDAMASNKKPIKKASKLKSEAQSPMGGGMGDESASAMMPDPVGDPSMEPVQNLTTEEVGEAEGEVPSAVDKAPAWCVCPVTGSTDVDVEVQEDGTIKGICNESGVEFEALMKTNIEYKILNPTQIGKSQDDVADMPEAPEAPEVPTLPVAAQISLNKNSLTKIASGFKQNGHVCPSCGHKHCTAGVNHDGHSEYTCDKCGTEVTKDIIVSKKDPKQSFMRIAWNLVPDMKHCEDCKKEALKFATKLKASKLLKTASESKDDFPSASCIERLARQYGGDRVATYGPCKDKLLAECVCKELQKLGFRKVKHMNRIATASLASDPMDECIQDQIDAGAKESEAKEVCACLKKKYANKENDSFLVQAFSQDLEKGSFSKEDLLAIEDELNAQAEAEKIKQERTAQLVMIEEEEKDIGELDSIDLGDDGLDDDSETVEIELTKEVAEELCDSLQDGISEESETIDTGEVEVEEFSEEPELDSIEDVPEFEETEETLENEREMALAMKTIRIKRSGENYSLDVKANQKAKPTMVETIEGEVEAGVPRKDARIRNEPNIEAKKPDVPRADANMGHEAEAIPKGKGPEYPVNSEYLGNEQSVQSDMPEIKNKMKGTVIAKKLEEVDSVEDDVRAGVPRKDAKMGNEGKDNIDVDAKKPDVPRKDAKMGNEGKDNIDVDADAPDVPVGDAHMGEEKSAPGQEEPNNHKILKQVKQSKEQQMQKIAQARKSEAQQVASWLAANNRIDASDRESFNNVVDALSVFEIDKIASVAEKMFPVKKGAKKEVVASKNEGYSIPGVVIESKRETNNDMDTFTQKLSNSIDHWKGKFEE